MNREKLIAAGVNYDEGVKRFGGQAKLYEKYLKKFFDEPMMKALEEQWADKNIPGAFSIAHDLKGTAGSLSLNAYCKKIRVLTELLRHGNGESDYSKALEQAKALYEAALHAANEESL